MERSRDDLIAEARERGRAWGRRRVEGAAYLRQRFPTMLDGRTRHEAYDTVADIMPPGELGEVVVEAAYEAARDEYDAALAVVKEQRRTKTEPWRRR